MLSCFTSIQLVDVVQTVLPSSPLIPAANLSVTVTMDVLSHFGELDELIQVIYQGFDRFVVLSAVAGSCWTLCVGLKGPEGRW